MTLPLYNTSYEIIFYIKVLYRQKLKMGADLISQLWLLKLGYSEELWRSEVPAGVTDHTLEVHWSMSVSLLIQHVIKDRVGH